MEGLEEPKNVKKLKKPSKANEHKGKGKKHSKEADLVHEEAQHHSDEEDSDTHDSSASDDDAQKNKDKKEKGKNAKTPTAKDITNDELEERKTYFFRTIKSKNWGKLIMNMIVAVIFIAYFIQIYVYD